MAKRVKKAERIEPAFKLKSVTLGIAQRCPTCGQFPEDFRNSFSRRVDELYVIPKKSHHYSAHVDGTPFEYTPADDCMSPDGLYTAVIVPHQYLGKVLLIKPEEEKPRRRDCQGGPDSVDSGMPLTEEEK